VRLALAEALGASEGDMVAATATGGSPWLDV